MNFLQQNLFFSFIQSLEVLNSMVLHFLLILQLKVKLGFELFANFFFKSFLNLLSGFKRRLETYNWLFFMAFGLAFSSIWNGGDIILTFFLFIILYKGFLPFRRFGSKFRLRSYGFSFAFAAWIICAFFVGNFTLDFWPWIASLMRRIGYEPWLFLGFGGTSLE